MRRLFVSSLVFATLSVAATAAGQQPAPQQLADEILVTASALPESVTVVPAAVTVITRDEIVLRAARDIASLLREVPGFHVARSGSDGKQTSLFTRGSGSKQTLVLWNGIELNNPYFSGYDWGRFSTAGVSQVEVVRGAYSALYGSEAMAGVVNVIASPRSNGLDVDVAVGDHGFTNGMADASIGGNTLSAYAAVEERRDDGFHPNDDMEQRSINTVVRWSPYAVFTAGLQARYTRYDLGIPFNTNAAGSELVPSLQRRQEGEERQISVPLGHTSRRFTTHVTASHNLQKDDFTDPEDPYGYFSAATRSNTNRLHAVTRASTPFGTILVGGEHEGAVVDDVSSYGTSLDGSDRKSNAVFLEDRFSSQLGGGGLELNIGARYDSFDTFGSHLSPRFSAAYILGRQKWRASYGEGFRAPSVGELYFPFSGNVDLEPEESRSAEVGWDGFFAAGTSLSVTLFHGAYDNLIDFDPVRYVFVNVDEATSQGVELGATSTRGRFRSSLSYTFLDTEENGSSRPLLRRPIHSGSFSGTWTQRNVSITGLVSHVGSRDDILPVTPYSRIRQSAYAVADLVVRVDLGRWNPYLRVENVGDARYEEVRGFEAPGRRALIGLRYSLE